MTRDQKVLGSNPGWVAAVWPCGHMPVQNCLLDAPKRPLGIWRKSRGLSPGSWFLSVADMSITVMKGTLSKKLKLFLPLVQKSVHFQEVSH